MRLEKTIISSGLLKTKESAIKVYEALCNTAWYDYIEDRVISYSWRGAGGYIAELRNALYQSGEDYMDYYCSGSEGKVLSLVEEILNRDGFVVIEGYYDRSELSDDEKLSRFKLKHPDILSYNRAKKLDDLL
jgi:hypothetical protein